jgi:hypothetical protein
LELASVDKDKLPIQNEKIRSETLFWLDKIAKSVKNSGLELLQRVSSAKKLKSLEDALLQTIYKYSDHELESTTLSWNEVSNTLSSLLDI